jgi:hypothetical protein
MNGNTSIALTDVDGTNLVTQAVPFFWGSGDYITFSLDPIPVAGWSSTVQMSSDVDSRLCAAIYSTAAGQTLENAGAGEVVNFGTVELDTHSAVTTGASFKFTAPIGGLFRISTLLTTTSVAWLDGEFIEAILRKNGSNVRRLDLRSNEVAASHQMVLKGSTSIYLNAGDYIDILVDNNRSGGDCVLDSNATYNWIAIERQSGPSAIAASETVTARYTTDASQSIPNNTATIVNFEDLSFDSHSAVTVGASWKFIAPVSGRFSVNAQITWSSVTLTSGQINSIAIRKNGVEYISDFDNRATGGSNIFTRRIADTIQLAAGDYIDVMVTQQSGGAITLNGTGSRNVISISKVGNY